MYFSIFTFKNQEEKPLSKFTEHLKQNSSPEGVSNRAFISYSSYKISTSEYFSISYRKKKIDGIFRLFYFLSIGQHLANSLMIFN